MAALIRGGTAIFQRIGAFCRRIDGNGVIKISDFGLTSSTDVCYNAQVITSEREDVTWVNHKFYWHLHISEKIY